MIDLKIGLNCAELARMLDEGKFSPAYALSMRDLGVYNWPHIAAQNGGVISFQVRHDVAKTARCYTTSPWHVQGVKGSTGLRAAFTSPYPGEVLIDMDWRCSAWAFLATRSRDQALINTMATGDLYDVLAATCGIERKQAKDIANGLLNGLSSPVALATSDDPLRPPAFPDAATAKIAMEAIKAALAANYPVASAYIKTLQDEAVSKGWISADKRYAGAGTALMQIEAGALWQVTSHQSTKDRGIRMVLPMHDGAVFSAPAATARECMEHLSRLMAIVVSQTKSPDVARWVKASIGQTWGAAPQVLGADLRAAAHNTVREVKAGRALPAQDLAVAAAVLPHDLDAAKASLPPASAAGRAVRAAIAAAKLALEPKPEAPPEGIVDLGEESGPGYEPIYRVITQDPAFPKPRWNARTSEVVLGTADVTKDGGSLLRRAYAPGLMDRYGWAKFQATDLLDAVYDAAHDDQFDPIRDYFDALAWDGKRRIHAWLSDLAGAKDLAEDVATQGLTSMYARKWLLSIVARAYQPGCKADAMLVLMGPQNAGKSTLLREIAPCGSYGSVSLDPDDKDVVLRASKLAIVEWAELAGASKREQEAMKAYLTSQEDLVRPPYARTDVKVLRRVIFAATTNEDDFLRDATGSRRYWPVIVGKIDVEGIRRDRDQLWAEAVHEYRRLMADPSLGDGCPWWLPEEAEKIRAQQARTFTAEDPLAEKIWAYVAREGGKVTLDGVLDMLDVKPSERTRIGKTVANSLKSLGLVSKTVKDNGRAVRRWVYEGDLGKPPRSLQIDAEELIFN
jgi:putative DNA primase/helicase